MDGLTEIARSTLDYHGRDVAKAARYLTMVALDGAPIRIRTRVAGPDGGEWQESFGLLVRRDDGRGDRLVVEAPLTPDDLAGLGYDSVETI